MSSKHGTRNQGYKKLERIANNKSIVDWQMHGGKKGFLIRSPQVFMAHIRKNHSKADGSLSITVKHFCLKILWNYYGLTKKQARKLIERAI